MVESKAWDWKAADLSWWVDPASEVYPLLNKWKALGFRRLLDLGCGIGRHSVLFAKNGFEVYATDLSKDGVEKLRELAVKEKLDITTEVSDMLSLPYKDSSFDCLIAFHVIFHTDEKGIKKAISELSRVLRKGGEALITFNSKNSSAYKDPNSKHLTENTIVKIEGHEAGIPHYYIDKEDVQELVKPLIIVDISYKEEYYSDSMSAHYFVLVKKK